MAIWLFDNLWTGHPQRAPHLTKACPVIATSLAAAVQPFKQDMLAPMLEFAQTLGVSNHTIIVVMPKQFSPEGRCQLFEGLVSIRLYPLLH